MTVFHPPTLSEAVTYPPEILSIIASIKEYGFECYLVGGIVRTLVLTREFPRDKKIDIDAEIRWSNALSNSTSSTNDHHRVLEKYQAMALFFKQHHKAYINRFHIISFKVKSQDQKFYFELSPPRKEIYHNNLNPHHSEFEIEIDFSLSLKDSLARRDFTVGAICINLTSDGREELFDPYGGVADLNNKLLIPVNEKSFHLDPVRGLRACRFLSNWLWPMNEKLRQALSKIHYDKNREAPFYAQELKKAYHPEKMEQLVQMYLW